MDTSPELAARAIPRPPRLPLSATAGRRAGAELATGGGPAGNEQLTAVTGRDSCSSCWP